MTNEKVMESDSIDPSLDADIAAPASGRYPRYGKLDALRGRPWALAEVFEGVDGE